MRQNVGAEFSLFALDDLDVGLHASLCELLREEIGDIGVRMQTSELSPN
jgi:hypothetical protein